MVTSSLPVIEIFTSIQGEGSHMGEFVTFIRLAGCNLACPWCDTKESWSEKNATYMDFREIANNVLTHQVVITGGEPTIHKGLMVLTDHLTAKHHYVMIETNGTNPVPNTVAWIVCSPKEENNFHIHNNLRPDELKYVVDEHFDAKLAIPEAIRAQYAGRIWLQPEGGRMQESWQECMRLVMNDPRLRVGVQLHKIMEVR